MNEKIYKLIFYLLLLCIFESKGMSKTSSWLKAGEIGDVVFNEIMADPTPVVQLPNKEYIELKSNSSQTINLKGWILEYNGKQKVLPDFVLKAGEYLIISGTGGKAIWDNYGQNIEVSGLTLPNAGVILKLFNPVKVMVDSFDYKPSLHRIGFSGGGYSLERINPLQRCGSLLNWKTSLSPKGGTPGLVNSVYDDSLDNTPPAVTHIEISNPSLLEVTVSELPVIHCMNGTIFSFSSITPMPDSVRFDQEQLKYFIYFLKNPLQNGVIYNLSVKNLTDECGNISASYSHDFWYFIPKSGDLLVNEVLFNPFPEGVDFVEIYNNSGKEVDLSELYLANRDNTLKLKSFYPLATKTKNLANDTYAVFTSDSAVLLSNYISRCPGCVYNMSRFPAYNMDEGWVVLLNKQMEVIDEFHYLESMHDPLISDVKGISLERRSFSKPSNEPTNWHSAAQSVGFATPGYVNSVSAFSSPTSTKLVIIDPQIFSPNDDGYNDRIFITLSPGEPGFLANIRIYSEDGLEVRRLANNLTIGDQAVIEWDGTTNNHQKCRLGIYIVSVELFSLKSQRKQFKKAIVLTDRVE